MVFASTNRLLQLCTRSYTNVTASKNFLPLKTVPWIFVLRFQTINDYGKSVISQTCLWIVYSQYYQKQYFYLSLTLNEVYSVVIILFNSCVIIVKSAKKICVFFVIVRAQIISCNSILQLKFVPMLNIIAYQNWSSPRHR